MDQVQRAVAAIPAGRYIVAISGGIDSMVLLHALSKRSDVDSIVVHVNHGIRDDAHLDAQIIATFCTSHNIQYVSTDLHLAKSTSEAVARQQRYDFLQTCRTKFKADAILTAHHQNDLLETALINVLRGTGWRGIAPFVVTQHVLRPLEYVSKDAIKTYAATHKIIWREDSTNADQRYLRNYIRLSVMPRLDVQNPAWRSKIMRYIRNQQALRRTIEAELDTLLSVYVKNMTYAPQSSRYIWCMLPTPEAYELFQALCRRALGHSILQEQAMAALLFIKVAKPGKRMPLNDAWDLCVTREQFIVAPR